MFFHMLICQLYSFVNCLFMSFVHFSIGVFSFFDCFLKGLVLIKTFGIQEADTLHKLAQRELDEETVG